MSKLIVVPNSREVLDKILFMDIDGVILGVKGLSVNNEYYIDVDEVLGIDFHNKELFISINKIMHNNDLSYLEEVMKKLNNINCFIIFYDMAVYNIAKRLGMISKLIISQDHLNTSINSNNFYHNLGINLSYLSSDITCEELLEIKRQTKMKIMFTIYGYLPIFYSRRYLVTNYLKYIGENKGDKYLIVSDKGMKYPIVEEDYGTTIYTDKIINLINYKKDLEDVNYVVINGNMINGDDVILMINNYLNNKTIESCYVGFFNTKTIYQVK